MSRPIVRRLTATITLAAVLCLAAPAAAAPPSRSHSPVVLGPSLLDQFFAWLGSLWLGHEPQWHGSIGKGGALVNGGGNVVTDQNRSPEPDRTSSIDPNG